MLKVLVGVKDVLTGFTGVTIEDSDEIAVRSFCYQVKAMRADKRYVNVPIDDLQLYHLGVFDSETGKLSQPDIPDLLIEARSVRGEITCEE